MSTPIPVSFLSSTIEDSLRRVYIAIISGILASLLCAAALLWLTAASAMLQSYLASKCVVLASASPRRAQILRENLNVPFNVVVSGFSETIPKESCKTCKALDIIDRLKSEGDSSVDIVISADTIVVCDNTILEKPLDSESARVMLKMLSGRTHEVKTSCTIGYKSKAEEYKIHNFCETTKVTFAELTEETIADYIASKEPLDKAGSYGIQGLGSQLVECIEGCYFNVVGFPVHRFVREMKKILFE